MLDDNKGVSSQVQFDIKKVNGWDASPTFRKRLYVGMRVFVVTFHEKSTYVRRAFT